MYIKMYYINSIYPITYKKRYIFQYITSLVEVTQALI